MSRFLFVAVSVTLAAIVAQAIFWTMLFVEPSEACAPPIAFDWRLVEVPVLTLVTVCWFGGTALAGFAFIRIAYRQTERSFGVSRTGIAAQLLVNGWWVAAGIPIVLSLVQVNLPEGQCTGSALSGLAIIASWVLVFPAIISVVALVMAIRAHPLED